MTLLTQTELRDLQKLQQRKGRKESGCFLIESEKIIAEAKKAGLTFTQLITTETFQRQNPALIQELQGEAELRLASSSQLKKLSSLITAPEIIVVAKQLFYSLDQIIQPPIMACFADISDPGNLGTMIRTADWFGLKGILLSPQTVDPYNEKVIRSAMGSLFHVRLYQSPELIQDLREIKKKGFNIIATHAHATTTLSLNDRPLCLLMGSEAHGIPLSYQNESTHVYSIPGKGQAESLNVAVSFGITLYNLGQIYK